MLARHLDQRACHRRRVAAALEFREGEVRDLDLVPARRRLEGAAADALVVDDAEVADPGRPVADRPVQRRRRHARAARGVRQVGGVADRLARFVDLDHPQLLAHGHRDGHVERMVAALRMTQGGDVGDVPVAVVAIEALAVARVVDDVDVEPLPDDEADEGLVTRVGETVRDAVRREPDEVAGADAHRAFAERRRSEAGDHVEAFLLEVMGVDLGRVVARRHGDQVGAEPAQSGGVPEGLVVPDRVRVQEVDLPDPVESRDVVRAEVHVVSRHCSCSWPAWAPVRSGGDCRADIRGRVVPALDGFIHTACAGESRTLPAP